MGLRAASCIKINSQKKSLHSAERRCLLIPVSFIKNLKSIFVDLVGEKNADKLIYKTGEAIGKSYSQGVSLLLKKEKTKASEETRIRMSCDAVSTKTGWGKIKIQEIDFSKKKIVAKITNSPSREVLKNSKYSIERGILAGIYEDIKKQEVYCRLLKEDKIKHSAVLRTEREIPKKIKKKEKVVLFTKKELEKLIERKTEELRDKINEMKKIQSLTVGRELKMIELKEQIKEMERQLRQKREAENFLKASSLKKEKENCWDFWKCKKEIKEKCPAFQSNSGRECWLVASSYCPHVKKEFRSCTECPWFKKLNF